MLGGFASSLKLVKFVMLHDVVVVRPGSILVPRGRALFGQHQESRPLDRPYDIPVLNGFVNPEPIRLVSSDLSDLTLSMRRVTGSP